ncbi:hypothetical protein GCM10020260_11970 [Nesterenkonia halobia]|uniref:Glycosyltransferase 2-like domain-containing protein n=1 Tax=Nesterenkonia halobia TaxID=37922 RepID=A0ABP6RBC8_9MICC
MLGETIESVQRQSMSDFELLIGDDGSSDGTVSLAESYAATDERIHVHHFTHSGDPGVVRSRLAELAGGENIAYVDHDDVLHTEHLAVLDRAISDAHPAAVAGVLYRYEDVEERSFSRSGEYWSHEIAVIDPVAEPSRVGHRRSLFKVATWRRSHGGLEDWDLWWRLADNGVPFSILDAVTVTVRIYGGSRRNRLRHRPAAVLGHATDEARAREIVATMQDNAFERFQQDLVQWRDGSEAFESSSAMLEHATGTPPSWLSPDAMPGGPLGWNIGFFAPVVDRAHATSILDVLMRRFPHVINGAFADLRDAAETVTDIEVIDTRVGERLFR